MRINRVYRIIREVKMVEVLRHFISMEADRRRYAEIRDEMLGWVRLSDKKFIGKVRKFGVFCITPPGSSGGLRLPCPLSGKEAHVAVSSSPKNHPYSFRRKWLKPPATGRIDSSGVSFDDRFYADVSNSLLYSCHHPLLPICDEFAVPLH